MNSTALFETVPRNDYLELFPGGRPDYHRAVQLLDLTKKDIAKASDIPIPSVRFDQKMPKVLEDRVREWAIALSKVAEYFQDGEKTVLWFKTTNPLLGNITPRDMIRFGRFRKLHKFIMSALSENVRPSR